MKRIVVSSSLAAAIAAATGAGCSASSSGNRASGAVADASASADSGNGNPPVDDGGGASDDGGGASDDGGGSSDDSGGPNAPLPDGSVYPHGTQLVPGGTLALNGVTSDDYVIYTDLATSTTFALSLAAGSKPISLGTVDASSDVLVMGKVVLLGTSTDNNGIGTVSVWTSSAPAPAPLALATFVGQGPSFAVSADGSHVAYIDGVDSNVVTASIVVAATDGTSKSTLVASLDVGDDFCAPQIGFAASAYVVAAYCPIAAGATGLDAGEPDGGTTTDLGIVSTYAAASNWASATLATNVQTTYSVDRAGTSVVVNSAAGTQVYPVAGGGKGVTLDATGALGEVTSRPGVFTSDGSHFLYTTDVQALNLAPIVFPPGTASPPVQLAAPGTFGDIDAVSGDGNWLVGPLNVDPNSGDTDLFLASATKPGTPIALSSATSAGFNGDLFTADSSHVIYLTAIAQGVGTLNAAPVAGPTSNPTALGTNALQSLATTGAQVVFSANFNSTANTDNGAADLFAVDTSTMAAPTLLVTQADPIFALNAEKTLVVYTWSYAPGANAGLWTLAP